MSMFVRTCWLLSSTSIITRNAADDPPIILGDPPAPVPRSPARLSPARRTPAEPAATEPVPQPSRDLTALRDEIELRVGELTPRGDAELPEYFPQVEVDGVRAEVELAVPRSLHPPPERDHGPPVPGRPRAAARGHGGCPGSLTG